MSSLVCLKSPSPSKKLNVHCHGISDCLPDPFPFTQLARNIRKLILLLTVPEKIYKVRKGICMRNIHHYSTVVNWCYVRDSDYILKHTVGF